MGRFRREPPLIDADDVEPLAGLASPGPGWPKSSRETVPSAFLSGATIPPSFAMTPHLYRP